MSYDTSLVINTGHEDARVYDVGNYTYNVFAMFREALGGDGWMDLDGQQAGGIVPKLRAAIADMADHPEKYRLMNPSNGWGNYEGALCYLRSLLEACEKHPLCKIRVS